MTNKLSDETLLELIHAMYDRECARISHMFPYPDPNVKHGSELLDALEKAKAELEGKSND